MNADRVKVSAFPGGFNWPAFIAIETGMFATAGIAVELVPTIGSVAQMTGLAAGEFEIAMTAFDNVVAYVEGQGEAKIGVQPEFFAFLSSDDSFLSLVAQPDITRAEELRGRVVSVDAATTGYAFVLFDLLQRAGLRPDDYAIAKIGGMVQRFEDLSRGGSAATLLSAPYDLLAAERGLRVLSRHAEPYQGNVAAARRSWANANRRPISAYARAYVDALVWLRDPANRAHACGILARNVLGMTPERAATSYARMVQDVGGFSRDGQFDDEGMRYVLKLRSRHAGGAPLADPERYIDRSVLARAAVL